METSFAFKVHRKWPGLLVTPLLLQALPASGLTGSGSAWLTYARRLSGEAKTVRTEMISKLRALPDLEVQLLEAVAGPERFLAYDVINALDMKHLFAEILARIETDESGFAVHTANALAGSENRLQLIHAYRSALERTQASPTARIALLDTLARLGGLLSENTVERHLWHESHEVRLATVGYLRTAILKQGQKNWTPRLRPSLSPDQPWQVRVQALFLISELDPRSRRELARSLGGTCSNLPDAAARKKCESLARLGEKP